MHPIRPLPVILSLAFAATLLGACVTKRPAVTNTGTTASEPVADARIMIGRKWGLAFSS